MKNLQGSLSIKTEPEYEFGATQGEIDLVKVKRTRI